MALLLHEIGFIRNEDAGVRIEGEKFPRRLRQAVAGHDEHRLVDEAEPALIGIGGSLAAPPLPHHRTYGSVYGGSRICANALRSRRGDRAISNEHWKDPR